MNNIPFNRTKIVATIGPATSSLEKLKEIILLTIIVSEPLPNTTTPLKK
jgi:hypothetical protein